MTWDQALVWIAGICGALLTIGNVMAKATSPIHSLEERMAKLEKKVDDNETHLRFDKAALDKQEHVNTLFLESLVLILEHEATGNHNDDMQVMAGKIKAFIYNESSKLK